MSNRASSSSSLALLLAVCVLLSATAREASAQAIRFVDASAPAGGNGASWATAYADLRVALLAVQSQPAVTQLWIADGVYVSSAGAFPLRNNLALYGGFAGGESSLEARDPEANPTILSGAGSFRVVNGGSVGPTAVVDGVTIRDGFTPGQGAGVLGGSPTFRGVRFIANQAGLDGGAWYGYANAPRFIRCVFEGNGAGETGGALSTYEGSILAISCRFSGNQALDGGAGYTYAGVIEIVNSLAVGNAAEEGGAAFSTYEGSIVLRSATVADNSGAALFAYEGPGAVVRNSIIWNNPISGPSSVSWSCVQGGVQGGGQGEGNTSGDPRFIDPAAGDYRLGFGSAAIDAGNNDLLPSDAFDLDRDGNLAEPLPLDLAGGPRRRDDPAAPDAGVGRSPVVDMGAIEALADCNGNGVEDALDIAKGTSADVDGNGVPDECEDCNDNGLPDSLDIAAGTSADCQGDGVPDECQLATVVPRTYGFDDGTDENEVGVPVGGEICWLTRFDVQPGGEILREVSFAWGSGLPEGAIVFVLVWSDPDADGVPDDAVVRRFEFVEVVAPGSGAFQTVDLEDLYLGPAGTPFFVGALVNAGAGVAPLDQNSGSAQRSWIAAAPGAVLDPGRLGDAPLFGLIDAFDFPGDWLIRAVGWRTPDCNGNGVPDECDIAAGALDCQGDGIPDVCQLAGSDCNANGVPDDCDIASGLLADCQPNFVPDVCEIASGSVADVDGNGVPDVCEDCDGDGVPDGLEIAQGAPDCQADGVPDACQLGSGAPYLYALDDADPEFYIASDAPNMAWIQRFVIEPNRETISAIHVMDGQMPFGQPIAVYLWSDPDGDGDPTDARVLTSIQTLVSTPLEFVYNRVEIPPTYVGPAGTSYFVGVITSFEPFVDFPAPKDSTFPTGTSWLVGSFDEIDPNDLSAGADEFLLIDDLGGPFIGVWCLRAEAIESNDCNDNGVPDDCDIADGTSGDSNRNGIPDECEADCAPDLDGDRVVGPADLAILLGAWSSPKADLDGDGTTGPADLAILLGSWGGC